jgi:hypothetical protein
MTAQQHDPAAPARAVAEPRSSPAPNGRATPFQVGSVLSAVGSLGYVAMNFVGTPREAYAHPANVVACALAAAGALVLALGMMRWRPPLPPWMVALSAAGLAAAAANAWFFATGTTGLARGLDDATFDRLMVSDWMLAMALPKMLLCLVGFIALGVTGWRTRAIPRTAAAALVVGGVLSLIPPHPPGLICVSVALLVIARKAHS